jgi:hypothetical protein
VASRLRQKSRDVGIGRPRSRGNKKIIGRRFRSSIRMKEPAAFVGDRWVAGNVEEPTMELGE